ncbi:MAG: hypothetical protein ABH827_01380 [bacterium]
MIIKQVGTDFHAVSETDQNKDAIYDILMKYQWPMCTAKLSKISLKEKKQLFKLQEDGEEQFIQEKIRELLDGADYHVVFVPTVIYELYCLGDEMLFNETKYGATGIG